jgi:hypothetical protein
LRALSFAWASTLKNALAESSDDEISFAITSRPQMVEASHLSVLQDSHSIGSTRHLRIKRTNDAAKSPLENICVNLAKPKFTRTVINHSPST